MNTAKSAKLKIQDTINGVKDSQMYKTGAQKVKGLVGGVKNWISFGKKKEKVIKAQQDRV